MKVVIAHTGKGLDVKAVSASDKVLDLKSALVATIDISIHDQILLCEDGAKLDKSFTFGQIPALLKPDAVVYLFNRQHLVNPPQPTKPLDPDEFNVKLPPAPKSAANHALSSSASLMIRALPDYEVHFAHHIELARAYQRTCVARYSRCAKEVAAQHKQLKALEAVIKNLSGHARHMNRSFNEFQTAFNAQIASHSTLTANFETDLESLGRVELHPILQQLMKKLTLLECFSESDIRKAYLQCAQSFEALATKIKDLSQTNGQIQKRVPDDAATFHAPDLETIELEMKKWDKRKQQQESDLQVLDQDYKKIKTVVEETVKQLRSNGKAPNATDHMQAFELQHNQHREEILKRFESDDQWLKQVMIALVDSSVKVQSLFFKKLTEVRDAQQDIESSKSKTVLFTAQMARQQKLLEQLLAVKQLPHVYKACLVEISRRREYRRTILAIGKEQETKLNALRTDESKRRDQFHATYQLPNKFLDTLLARPTQWVMTLADSDLPLPAIDDAHVPASGGASGGAGAGASVGVATSVGPSASASGVTAATAEEDAKAAAAALDRIKAENQMLRAELALLKSGRPLSQTINTLRNNDSPANPALPIDDSVAFTPHAGADIKSAPSSNAGAATSQIREAQSTIERQTAEINEMKRVAEAERIRRDEQLAVAVKRAEAAAAALIDEQKRAETALAELRKVHESSTATEAARHQKTEADLNGGLATLRTEVEALTARATAAATAEQTLRSDVTSLQQKLADAKAALETAAKAAAAASAVSAGSGIGSGGSDIASSAKHSSDCHDAVVRTTAMLRDRNQTIEAQNKKLKELSADNMSEKAKVDELTKNNVHVELELKKKVEEAKKMAASKKDLESQIAEREERINKLLLDQKTHESQCTVISNNLINQTKTLEKEKAAANSEIKSLKDENAAWKVELAAKLTYRNFHMQDTALFIRNPQTGFYEALNRNAPNYFLALDQKSAYEQFGDRVLGHIFMIEKETASAAAGGNPFRLPTGAVYFRVYADFESVDGKPDSSKDGKSKPPGGAGPADGKRDK